MALEQGLARGGIDFRSGFFVFMTKRLLYSGVYPYIFTTGSVEKSYQGPVRAQMSTAKVCCGILSLWHIGTDCSAPGEK